MSSQEESSQGPRPKLSTKEINALKRTHNKTFEQPPVDPIELKRRHIDVTPVVAASEAGFKGDSKEWFDDAQFMKETGIDLSKKDHDYYYGSYSSFHIHEEMLKDTVRTRAY
jgi:hypothetical protein